jgi:hypothetical protein
MPLPTPPGDLTSPIPNQPFDYPDENFLEGAYSPVIVGEGLRISGDYLKTAANNATVILEDTTFYVAIDGSDETGDGSAANPWYSPHKAMEFLSGFIILDTVQVTISVGEGEWTFNEPLNVDHPYGSQITISGQGSNSRPSPPQISQGVSGYNVSTKVINDEVLRQYHNTIWNFNGCNGIEAFSVSGVTLDKLMIAGLVDTDNQAGVCMGTVLNKNYPNAISYTVKASSASITLGQVAIFNFYLAGVLCVGGRVTFKNDCGVVCGCGDNGGYFGGGLLALANGIIIPSTSYAVNNQWGWAAAEGGFIAGGRAFVQSNQNGVYVASNGNADLTSGNGVNNVDVAFKVDNGGLIRARYLALDYGSNTVGNFAEIGTAGLIDLRNCLFPAGATFDPPVDTVSGLRLIKTV